MYFFKKLVAPLLSPYTICLELMLVGLVLIWFTRAQRAGRWLTTFGFLLLVLLGQGALSALLLDPLESRYPPFEPASLSSNPAAPVRWIVVLSGGHTPDPARPLSSHLTESSLVRLIEGIRLHRELPHTTLVVSGGTGFGRIPSAKTMAKVARLLQIEPGNIKVESGSKDTAKQARLLKPLLGQTPFILVTSASHMRRAVALFDKYEMRPIPAPTDYLVKRPQAFHPGMLIPGSSGFEVATAAVHEYLGFLWARLRGQI